jgi:tRNA threonylcarbamoyladenosine biosynthesis protein TsaB
VILAVETSTPSASVALLRGGEVLAQAEAEVPRRHLEWLAPAIRRLLDEAGLQPPDVQALAVSTGPGGFTSLRIGLATALAWARARNVPLVGISTLAVVAAGVGGAEPVCAVVDVRQGAVAAALFVGPDAVHPRAGPVVGTVDDVLRRLPVGPTVTFAGDALRHYADLLQAARPGARCAPPSAWVPTAAALGRLACRRLSRGERDDLYRVRPLYVRPAVATGEPPVGGAVAEYGP